MGEPSQLGETTGGHWVPISRSSFERAWFLSMNVLVHRPFYNYCCLWVWNCHLWCSNKSDSVKLCIRFRLLWQSKLEKKINNWSWLMPRWALTEKMWKVCVDIYPPSNQEFMMDVFSFINAWFFQRAGWSLYSHHPGCIPTLFCSFIFRPIPLIIQSI